MSLYNNITNEQVCCTCSNFDKINNECEIDKHKTTFDEQFNFCDNYAKIYEWVVGEQFIKCSNCGNVMKNIRLYSYCPECGKKMRNGGEKFKKL